MSKEAALADYITVNERIMEFYDRYPEGRIINEIVSWEDGVVVVRSSVYKDHQSDKPISVDYAYEKEGSSYINKTSALENCCTSAAGRSIALAGIALRRGGHVASREEVENAKLQQDVLNQEKNLPAPDQIKIKYQVGKGDLDGFDEWFSNMKSKGNTHQQIETVLTQKLMERGKQ